MILRCNSSQLRARLLKLVFLSACVPGVAFCQDDWDGYILAGAHIGVGVNSSKISFDDLDADFQVNELSFTSGIEAYFAVVEIQGRIPLEKDEFQDASGMQNVFSLKPSITLRIGMGGEIAENAVVKFKVGLSSLGYQLEQKPSNGNQHNRDVSELATDFQVAFMYYFTDVSAIEISWNNQNSSDTRRQSTGVAYRYYWN